MPPLEITFPKCSTRLSRALLILSAENSGSLQDRNSSMSFIELKSNFDLLASSLIISLINLSLPTRLIETIILKNFKMAKNN